jgi:hypothetical protein
MSVSKQTGVGHYEMLTRLGYNRRSVMLQNEDAGRRELGSGPWNLPKEGGFVRKEKENDPR